MARYVDGFVIAVPKKKIGVYVRMARQGAALWKKYGALEYYECVGDDLEAKFGSMPFTRLARLKKNETVVFSWIVYKSRAHRDKVNAKVMKDPSMNEPEMMKSMPFQMNRMAYGGFKVLVAW